LQQALEQELLITDEASAIEALGLQPVVVEGRRDNIKVTHADDMSMAAFFLGQQAGLERGVL